MQPLQVGAGPPCTQQSRRRTSRNDFGSTHEPSSRRGGVACRGHDLLADVADLPRRQRHSLSPARSETSVTIDRRDHKIDRIQDVFAWSLTQ